MNALDQFKRDKLIARELSAECADPEGYFVCSGNQKRIVLRALTMFADQDETKQNDLVLGK